MQQLDAIQKQENKHTSKSNLKNKKINIPQKAI
jgi:hypothetical protein